MGGVTVATCATTHSEDIRGIIFQYPAIFLNEQAYEVGAEYDVNRFENPVLLLQGDNDKIVAKILGRALRILQQRQQNHCRMIIYGGQPHVFTGKYKVIAARDIYDFIND